MLSLSSRIITVHCLKVSLPMKSTAWLQKENSLRILMMTLHYRIMPRQHEPQRRILMMTTHDDERVAEISKCEAVPTATQHKHLLLNIGRGPNIEYPLKMKRISGR